MSDLHKGDRGRFPTGCAIVAEGIYSTLTLIGSDISCDIVLYPLGRNLAIWWLKDSHRGSTTATSMDHGMVLYAIG